MFCRPSFNAIVQSLQEMQDAGSGGSTPSKMANGGGEVEMQAFVSR
jgi:hypothetical protein